MRLEVIEMLGSERIAIRVLSSTGDIASSLFITFEEADELRVQLAVSLERAAEQKKAIAELRDKVP